MKIFILFTFLFFSISSFSQVRQDAEIQRIDLKLEKFRHQHQTGTLLSIIGIAVSALPLTGLVESDASIGFVTIGSSLALSGAIISIDSYKHLKLESKRKRRQKEMDTKVPKRVKPKNWWTPR